MRARKPWGQSTATLRESLTETNANLPSSRATRTGPSGASAHAQMPPAGRSTFHVASSRGVAVSDGAGFDDTSMTTRASAAIEAVAAIPARGATAIGRRIRVWRGMPAGPSGGSAFDARVEAIVDPRFNSDATTLRLLREGFAEKCGSVSGRHERQFSSRRPTVRGVCFRFVNGLVRL